MPVLEDVNWMNKLGSAGLFNPPKNIKSFKDQAVFQTPWTWWSGNLSQVKQLSFWQNCSELLSCYWVLNGQNVGQKKKKKKKKRVGQTLPVPQISKSKVSQTQLTWHLRFTQLHCYPSPSSPCSWRGWMLLQLWSSPHPLAFVAVVAFTGVNLGSSRASVGSSSVPSVTPNRLFLGLFFPHFCYASAWT